MTTTLTYVDWWTQTHATDAAAQQMWESKDMPHRDHILGAVDHIGLTDGSLYELGCGSGPNLARLRDAFPQMRLGGSEPCDAMARWAECHLDISIDREPLPALPSGQWDAILSCYVLAYVEEAEIAAILRGLREERPKALILMEPSTDSGHGLSANLAHPRWFHDYLRLLPATGWTILWRWPIAPVDFLRDIIVAR